MASKITKIVEKQILDKLEEGVVPWIKGWGGIGSSPRNIISDKAYQGINRLFTGMQGYSSPYWMSYKQAKELKGNVKKGEKGTKIIWAAQIEKKNPKEGEKSVYSAFRYSAVFNLGQCENVQIPKKIQKQIDAKVEIAAGNSNIIPPYDMLKIYIDREAKSKKLSFSEGKEPSYNPKKDTINMPFKQEFFVKSSIQEYISTLAHECIHSTGHWLRLDRKFNKELEQSFGSDSYAQEELIAEIGSAFICAELGIERVLENQVAYIAGWKKKIKSQEGIVVKSSSLAQKAVNYIKEGEITE